MKSLIIIISILLGISIMTNVILIKDYRTLEVNDFSADELDFTRVAYQEGYFQGLSDLFFRDIGLPYMKEEIVRVCETRSFCYKARIKTLLEKSYGIDVYANTVDHQENMLIDLIKAQPLIWTFSALHDRNDQYRCPWCLTLVPDYYSDCKLQWVDKRTNKIVEAPFDVQIPNTGPPMVTTEVKLEKQ